MSRPRPTDEQLRKLQVIEERKKWIAAAMPLSAILMLVALQVSERYGPLQLVLLCVLTLLVIGGGIYLSFCQRCPRCSGWIVIPKCPSCGLAPEK